MINNQWATILATAALTYTTLGFPLAAKAVSLLPSSVLPPDATFAGKTLYEWSADWWQTFLEAPLVENPLISEDPDGTALEAINGLKSPVFSLTGSLGSTGIAVNRTVTVSDRQGIFFPLINNAFILTEPFETVEMGCDIVVASTNDTDVNSLFATLDGENIGNLGSQRQSCGSQTDLGVFSVEAKAESLFNRPLA